MQVIELFGRWALVVVVLVGASRRLADWARVVGLEESEQGGGVSRSGLDADGACCVRDLSDDLGDVVVGAPDGSVARSRPLRLAQDLVDSRQFPFRTRAALRLESPSVRGLPAATDAVPVAGSEVITGASSSP